MNPSSADQSSTVRATPESVRKPSISRRELLIGAGGAAAGALIYGCGGGGGGGTFTTTLFTNPGDSRLSQMVNASGRSVTIFGTRDADGLASAVTGAAVDAPDGNPDHR